MQQVAEGSGELQMGGQVADIAMLDSCSGDGGSKACCCGAGLSRLGQS